ncbi:MAG: ABC transporter permease subunit [Candidatus Syntropharchaeia archaeon]
MEEAIGIYHRRTMMSFEHIILNVAIWFGFYLIVSLSLHIEYGFGGIPNFGRALAVLMGAIAVGALVNRILMLILGVSGNIITASGEVKSLMNDLLSKNPLFGILLLLLALIFAAIAGALYSLYTLNVIATSFSRVEWTFYPFLMILLGGIGNHKGGTNNDGTDEEMG